MNCLLAQLARTYPSLPFYMKQLQSCSLTTVPEVLTHLQWKGYMKTLEEKLIATLKNVPLKKVVINIVFNFSKYICPLIVPIISFR